MSLKYYNASMEYAPDTLKQTYENDYNAILDATFDNAHNVAYDEIEYEQTYGELDFATIHRVRVDTIVNFNTGIYLGDDYKTFVFPPEFNVETYYGMKFRWKNNYWLAINTNTYGTLANTVEVRRCNNILRFFSLQGEKIFEPCIMDYTLRFTKNEDTKEIMVGKAEQKMWFQRNKRTENFKPNMRFLFGTPNQRVAYRIYGAGLKNYMNDESDNDYSPTLSEVYMQASQINPSIDDLQGGYADAAIAKAEIILSRSNFNLEIGDSALINAQAFIGTDYADSSSIYWFTSNDKIVSLNEPNEPMNDITVTANNLGSATIVARLDSTDIVANLVVTVVEKDAQDNFELIVSPNEDYVYQGESRTYEVGLYKNGIRENVDITFSDITTKVPLDKYEIKLGDNNSFTIYNKGMYMKAPVIVRCTYGNLNKDINIALRGLF